MTTDAAPAGAPAASGNTTSTPAKADGTPAPEKGAASATPAPPTEYEFDFDGKPRKYSQDELRTNYLKGKSAAQMLTKSEQRLKEATEREKKSSAHQERAKKGELAKVLEEWGLDPRRAAEELLLPDIQREMMSPAEQHLLAAQRRAEEAERRLQERDETEKSAREEAETVEHQQRLGQAFVAALEKAGLPKTSAPWAVKRMAALQEKADELELDFHPDELATLVRDDFQGEHRSIASTMDGEQLWNWLGEDTAKKLVRHEISRMKAQRTPAQSVAAPPTNGHAHVTNGTKQKHLTTDEWAAEVQRRIREG